VKAPKNLLPLVDADILAHEVATLGEFVDEEGEKQILPFHSIIRYFDEKVEQFKLALDTRFEPIMYLTGDTNFREVIAQRKGYKANRDRSKKPFHLENARAYIRSRYNTYVSNGCEADDLLVISQMDSLRETGFKPETAKTVIVTRDKDLRQCMGWHYGWECGNQPEFRLQWVDEIGELNATYKEGVSPKTGKPTRSFNKISGTGLKWLYAQCLLGDVVDNIPGLSGVGKKRAYDVLHSCDNEGEMLRLTVDLYKDKYGDEWEKEFLEQMHLVYMIRERNEDGSLKWWSFPEGFEK
jgi:hypothetical protein